MTQIEFQQIASTIPSAPGIYKYFDQHNELLYVGKAKNLKKRVSSYFTKTLNNYKTNELVKRIDHIEFTIVNSEQDAFLLENSLIKEFQPRFNINLKDDKTYPYIVIKNEHFPRVFFTRHKLNDGSQYLGPFTSVRKVRDLLTFIRQYVLLRTCKLNLSPQNIAKKKFKVCLEYHLGNCKGPCEGFQTEEDYNSGLQQVTQILKGNLQPVIQSYRRQMQDFAASLEFEKAEAMRKKIQGLEDYQASSIIIAKHVKEADVFSVLKEHQHAYVNYLMVQNGTIVQTHTIELKTPVEETEEDVLSFAIHHLRSSFNSNAPEVIVPVAVALPYTDVAVTVPKAGERKKLLDLSVQNVTYFQKEIQRRKLLHVEGKTETEIKDVLIVLQQDLKLPEVPYNIECFDNSNLHGTFPVSAMVSFKNGMPSKKDYRHFKVKTVEGINDFATMKEVVLRRYTRLLAEKQELPQLVIIDGGKGQLSAAMESIEQLKLKGKLTVVGLAKNEEEIFFPGDSQSLKLDWDSSSLKLLRRIRDEVHNFGINFHRQLRSKNALGNELENIPGIGKRTALSLLKHFKSVKNIREQPKEELARVAGAARAAVVWNYFHPEKA